FTEARTAELDDEVAHERDELDEMAVGIDDGVVEVGADRGARRAHQPPSGSTYTSTLPSSTTVPSWFVIVVRSVPIGLSARASVTSTSAVISSPGLTGARKFQSTCKKTLPGPGRSSATTAWSSPVVTPPCTMMPPKRLALASASS